MMRGLWIGMVLAVGVACNGGADGTPFGSGGEKGEEPGYPGEDGTSMEGSPPEITSLNVVLDDFGSEGDVLIVEVGFTDADDDVYDAESGEGGMLMMSVEGEGGDAQDLSASIGSATGESSEAYIDPDTGSIISVLGSIDPELSYTLTVTLQDIAGNTSMEAEGSYSP